MSETKIVPIRPLSDAEALAWIAGQGRVETTGTALARDWAWSRTKVRRRLAGWSAAGLVTVEPGPGGRTIVAPVAAPAEEPAADPPEGQPEATLPAATAPVAEPATIDLPEPVAVNSNVPAVARMRVGRAPAPATTRLVDLLAYAVAIGLAGTAAYFSIHGMIVLFPGAPTSIVAMAVSMECAKLVGVAWLARQWHSVGFLLRAALILLIAGLAAINAAGVYSQLVAAHLGDRMAATSSVETDASRLAARIEVQGATVADLDKRIAQLDAAIAEMTKRGRTSGALEAIGKQRKAREVLVAQRRHEADTLAGLKSEAGAVSARGHRIENEAAPIRYVAQLMGGTTDDTIRLLILLMVLTCDPLAIALTAAAAANSRHRRRDVRDI